MDAKSPEAGTKQRYSVVTTPFTIHILTAKLLLCTGTSPRSIGSLHLCLLFAVCVFVHSSTTCILSLFPLGRRRSPSHETASTFIACSATLNQRTRLIICVRRMSLVTLTFKHAGACGAEARRGGRRSVCVGGRLETGDSDRETERLQTPCFVFLFSGANLAIPGKDRRQKAECRILLYR